MIIVYGKPATFKKTPSSEETVEALIVGIPKTDLGAMKDILEKQFGKTAILRYDGDINIKNVEALDVANFLDNYYQGQVQFIYNNNLFY